MTTRKSPRARQRGAPPRIRSRHELRGQRRRTAHSCWDHLLTAPLWPLHGANLGTLLRTCDAVGACLAVPRFSWVPEALARGNTLRHRSCVHWVNDPLAWLEQQRSGDTQGRRRGAHGRGGRLADLPAARTRTVMVLGHEQSGLPPEPLDLMDLTVEIPMVGTGHSLNVAVAGSLVLYRLAGRVSRVRLRRLDAQDSRIGTRTPRSRAVSAAFS